MMTMTKTTLATLAVAVSLFAVNAPADACRRGGGAGFDSSHSLKGASLKGMKVQGWESRRAYRMERRAQRRANRMERRKRFMVAVFGGYSGRMK